MAFLSIFLNFEGFGVDHAHLDKDFTKYKDYISSHDYVKAEDKELEKLVRKITS